MEANEGRWLPHGKHHGCGDGPHEAPWDIHDHHRGAPHCDDQLAVFSTVGRGLRGDGFLVRIKSDTDSETYLEGLVYDAATNEYHTEWVSENINGGKLMYQYNLRTFSDPQTFTITFRYVRPERTESEWVWTTPAIPYLWDADNNGVADVDGITGSGVATLFLKKTTDPEWVMKDIPTNYDYEDSLDNQEKLLYPEDWTREMFNAPSPLDPWTVNLEYGIGGDIDAPNIEDLAKILGISVPFIRRLVEERDLPADSTTFGNKPNGDPMDTKEYIDKGDADVLDHLHNDLFGGTSGPNSDYANIPNNLKPLAGDDNGSATVWDWITYAIQQADNHLHADLGNNASQLAGDDSNPNNGWIYVQRFGANRGQQTPCQTVYDYINAAVDDIAEGMGNMYNFLNGNVYGGVKQNADGTYSLNVPGKMAVGNLNVFTNVNGSQATTTIKNANNTGNVTVDPNYIMTRNPANGDTRSI